MGHYERILRDINKANFRFARRLFQCVAVASRPLCVEELAESLVFYFYVGPTSAFSGGLFKYGGLTYAQFSYFPVREYLTSTRLAGTIKIISCYHASMTPVHEIMAQACLGILLHIDEKRLQESV